MPNDHPLFRATRVEISPAETSISRQDSMLWMGSCFVESMAPFLSECQFQACVNPMGVVFHPAVLTRLLQLTESDLDLNSFESQGVWKNYWVGAHFSGTKEDLQLHLQRAIAKRNEALSNAKWLVITWGTAFWYDHQSLGMVGKCHKQPSSSFEKKCSKPEDILLVFNEFLANQRSINPDLKVILTVSPVRHTRDTLVLNSVSKSTLRLAAQWAMEQNTGVFYFPSYELVMDELRDYRFFESDLVHPNKEAVDYIWARFEDQFFSPEIRQTNQLIRSFNQGKAHQPFAKFGNEYHRWQEDQKKKQTEIDRRLAEGF